MRRIAIAGRLVVVILGLILSAAADAAPGGDLEAVAIVTGARTLAIHHPANTPLNVTTRAEAERLLAQALQLQARAERGIRVVSAARMRSLEQTIDTLQDVLASAAVVTSGTPATLTGTLTGTVTDAVTLAPITSGISVTAYNFSTQTIAGSGTVGAGGVYSFTAAAPGTYTLRTNSANYVQQHLGGLNCVDGPSCPPYLGTVVQVPSSGATQSGLNFSLTPGGAISGTVKRASDNSVVSGLTITAQAQNFFFARSALSDASGNYTVTGLPAGPYIVYVDGSTASPPLQDTAYPNSPCGYTDCGVGPETLVSVTAGQTTPGINISLGTPASISGQVLDASSAPIADAVITLISEDRWTNGISGPGDPIFPVTDANGNYTILQVRPANYRVVVSAPGYLGKVWPNAICFDPASCDPIGIGGVVAVNPGQNVTGINVSLSAGATVSGTITRASNNTAVAGATVTAQNAQIFANSNPTDANGNYVISGLPDGVFTIYASTFINNPAINLADTGLGNAVCKGTFGNCSGPPIAASAATPLTGVNIKMATGGALSGVIIDAVSGAPVPVYSGNVRVDLLDLSGNVVAQILQSSASGYATAGIAPGTYLVSFAGSHRGLGSMDTTYNGLPCPRGSCDPNTLPHVTIDPNTPVTGYNGLMQRGAIISGHVLDAATMQPILLPAFDPTFNFGYVSFYAAADAVGGFGSIDGAGNFATLQGFSPGPLFSATFLRRGSTNISLLFGDGYIDQAYSGIACPYLSCGFTGATAITVATTAVSGINYVLSQGGSITGTVTTTGSTPVSGVLMQAFNGAGQLMARAYTNALGGYTLPALPTGSYFVTTSNTLGYLDQLYSGMLCSPFCNPVNGTTVSVAAPSITPNINFSFAQSATVSGTVSGTHSANVVVQIYGAIGNLLGSATTDASGNYSLGNLAGGTYFVRTSNAYGDIDALYNALPCVGSACQVRLGTPINLSAGQTASGINLVLSAPATIAGTVTDGTNPLSGIALSLYDARGALAESTTSDALGNYALASLASGSYYVVTRGTPNRIDVSYPNAPCPASCNGLNGTAISVTSGNQIAANFVLSAGGSISGTVNTGSGPLAGALVQVYNTSNVPVAQTATSASGNYQINTLADGSYYVRTQNGQGYLDQVYNAIPCSGACNGGNTVTLSGGIATPNTITFTLAPGGSISGNVSSSGATAIALATVQAYDAGGNAAASATTDSSGNYTIGGLKPGDYKLRTLNSAGYVNQVYNGFSCSPSPCNLSSGSPITVNGPVTGKSFVLAPGGSISGTASDQFHNPLSDGTATLFSSSGIQVTTAPVTTGQWEFNGLANGTYYVLIENTLHLIDQLYSSIACPGGACAITSGTPIVLNVPGHNALALAKTLNTAAIDVVLPPGSSISGNVKDAGTNAPIANATVYFFNSGGTLVGNGTSDGLGNYTSAVGLTAGTYYAATTNGSVRGVGNGYVNALYSGQNCLLACVVTSGTTITTGNSNVNFSLSKGLNFGGIVTGPGASPLALVTIQIYDSSGILAGSLTTDSLGRYTADGLPTGTYYARSINSLGLLDTLYGGTACAGNCNVLAGAPIVINNSTQPQNINFALTADRIFRNGFD